MPLEKYKWSTVFVIQKRYFEKSILFLQQFLDPINVDITNELKYLFNISTTRDILCPLPGLHLHASNLKGAGRNYEEI